jgi:hypothetical protein
MSILNNSEGAQVGTLITTQVEGDLHIHQSLEHKSAWLLPMLTLQETDGLVF